ncbi:MAG: alpha/beta fold hydrolase [Chitinophagaceae bacterium]|nr:alpha/beta fold hydrolase [Chitinophagaceae bacterium]
MAIPRLSPAQKLAISYYKAKLNLLNVVSPSLAAYEAFDLFTRPYGNPRRKRKSGWFNKAEPLLLESNGLKLTGFKWRSNPANDRKVLIIHGFAGSVGSFDRYLGGLLHYGYDVYAYEAPGHGSSQGNRLNTLLYSRVLHDIMGAHGPFDGYIAHSLGGLSLMLALHENPPIQKPLVALIAPATESTTAADKFFEFLQLPDDLRKSFEGLIKKRSGKPLEWFSISRVVPEVNARILWLHDAHDTTTPIADVYPLLHKKLDHVHFYFTEGLGHSGIYRDNKVKKRIIEFFSQDTVANEIQPAESGF